MPYQQTGRKPFVHHSRLFHGLMRLALAVVTVWGVVIFPGTAGWSDEPKPAVSRGGILALPPLRALIGASDPPSYDPRPVRQVPDDVVQPNRVSPKVGQAKDVQQLSKKKHPLRLQTKDIRKKGKMPRNTQKADVKKSDRPDQALKIKKSPQNLLRVKKVPTTQKQSAEKARTPNVTLPVVPSSPRLHVSPPLLSLSSETSHAYGPPIGGAPQVARHDLRSLVSLSDLETVVVSSQGVKVYSPYERPTHDGLSRAISFGGPNTSRSILVATIQYAHNSDRLGTDDRRVLEEVAVLHQQNGGHVRVVGHASSKAPTRREHVNLDISRRRAQKVASALRDMGVPRVHLRIAATADWNPRYNEGTHAGEAGNRRTEIWFDF